MKVKISREAMTQITTEVYQAKNGSVVLNWGDGVVVLDEKQANYIANDLDILDVGDYRKFYNKDK